MKTFRILTLAFFSLFTANIYANSIAELFTVEEGVLAEFESLNQIDYMIEMNNLTLDDLNSSTLSLPINIQHDGPLEIPSFWFGFIGGATSCLFPGLGCLGGPAAAIIIQTQTEDSEEVKKAWKGCIVGNIATTIPYLAIVALFYLY